MTENKQEELAVNQELDINSDDFWDTVPGGTRKRHLPYLDQKANRKTGRKAGPGKAFLAESQLPFYLTAGRVKESTDEAFGDTIEYNLEFHQGTEFEKDATRYDLELEYILTLPKDEERVLQIAWINARESEKLLFVLEKHGKWFKIARYKDQ